MKSNMKSIRMTDEVFNAVNEFRGNGFNEKFENLVYDFLRQREQFVREAELLQAHISDKRTEMKRVQQRIAKMRDVETRLAPLVNCVLNLIDTSN